MLQQIQNGEISTIAAAAKLEISTRTFNRLMLEAKVTRPTGQRAVQDQGAAENKRVRQQAARDALSGKYTVAKAAKLAGCCERTITRYMDAARG